MDRDAFTETLIDWIEHERTGSHLQSPEHSTRCNAYVRLAAAGPDVLEHVRAAYGSHISEYYWLFDEYDSLALETIKDFGFTYLVRAIDSEFSLPEQTWAYSEERSAYTRDWLEHRV